MVTSRHLSSFSHKNLIKRNRCMEVISRITKYIKESGNNTSNMFSDAKRCRMERLTAFEGTVTSINSKLAYVTVKNIKVHFAIAFVNNKITKMPAVGSPVTIKDGLRSNSNWIISEPSDIEGQFTVDIALSTYLNTIKTLEIKPVMYLRFTDNFTVLESKFDNIINDIDKTNIFNSLLRKLSHEKEEACDKVQLVAISSCKRIDILTDKYSDFPYWSHGIHPSERHVILFGYLEIHEKYGFYMIKDNGFQMPCIFINYLGKDIEMSDYNRRFVIVEKYFTVSEIYKDKNTPNTEYIVIDVDDVHTIYSKYESSELFGDKPGTFSNYITFNVLDKSTVCINERNASEIILDIFVFKSNIEDRLQQVFLLLPPSYVTLNYHFKEMYTYTLHYRDKLLAVKSTNSEELKRIKNQAMYRVPSGSYFQPNLSDVDIDVDQFQSKEPLSITKCKAEIERSTAMVSFRGIIKNKMFAKRFTSRTARRTAVYGFGTPGEKIHQIVFTDCENGSTIYLDVYLNNWEHLLMPLGLVPDMEVIVKNVLPQQNRYLKSTIMTSFQVVSFKGQINFDSVNLYGNSDLDWGNPTCLSQGDKVPLNTLAWGTVTNIFIIEMVLKTLCDVCHHVVADKKMCLSCNGLQRELEFKCRFKAKDHQGNSFFLTHSIDVLHKIMDLPTDEFKKVLDYMKQLGAFHYNCFEDNNQEEPTWRLFLEHIPRLEERQLKLDLKCRKTKETSKDGKVYWYCIAARRN